MYVFLMHIICFIKLLSRKLTSLPILSIPTSNIYKNKSCEHLTRTFLSSKYLTLNEMQSGMVSNTLFHSYGYVITYPRQIVDFY